MEEEQQEEVEMQEDKSDVFEEDDDVGEPEFPDMNNLEQVIKESMPDSYEDLVRDHVEAFYSSSRRYFQDSELSRRLQEWEKAVKVRLDEQAGRPQFDIYTYMDKILDSFDAVNETKSFEEVVGSIEVWEICRVFVAMLQLTNDNNISIEQKNENLQSITLTLLSKDRRRKRFEDYVPQT